MGVDGEWILCSRPIKRLTHHVPDEVMAQTYLGMTGDLPARCASVDHKRVSKPCYRKVKGSLNTTTVSLDATRYTYFSLPSPTAIILLLSPSQARSLLFKDSE